MNRTVSAAILISMTFSASGVFALPLTNSIHHGQGRWMSYSVSGMRFLAPSHNVLGMAYYGDATGRLFYCYNVSVGCAVRNTSPVHGKLVSLTVSTQTRARMVGVTDTGELYFSADAFKTWTTMGKTVNSSPAFGHSTPVVFDPLDPDSDGVYVGDTNGIWYTSDHGRSWTRFAATSSPVSALAVSSTSPQVVAAGLADGTVLVVTLGSTIVRITHPRKPNAVVSAIVTNPGDPSILYVGYDANYLGYANLYRTGNGGASWSPLNGPGSQFPDTPIGALWLGNESSGRVSAATLAGLIVSSDYLNWYREDIGLYPSNQKPLRIDSDASSRGFQFSIMFDNVPGNASTNSAVMTRWDYPVCTFVARTAVAGEKEQWMDVGSAGWSGTRYLYLAGSDAGIDPRTCVKNEFLPPSTDKNFWYDADHTNGFFTRFQFAPKPTNFSGARYNINIGIAQHPEPTVRRRGIFVDRGNPTNGYQGFAISLSQAGQGLTHCAVTEHDDLKPDIKSQMLVNFRYHNACVNVSQVVACGLPAQVGLAFPWDTPPDHMHVKMAETDSNADPNVTVTCSMDPPDGQDLGW